MAQGNYNRFVSSGIQYTDPPAAATPTVGLSNQAGQRGYVTNTGSQAAGYEAVYTTPTTGTYAVNPSEKSSTANADFGKNYGFAQSTAYDSIKSYFADNPVQPPQTVQTRQPTYTTSSSNATNPSQQAKIMTVTPSNTVKSVAVTTTAANNQTVTANVVASSQKGVTAGNTVPTSSSSVPTLVPQISKQNVPPNRNQPKLAFYCELCKVQCSGPQAFQSHMVGRNHKKKETNANKNVRSKGRSFFCDLCEVSCSCGDAYESHLQGAKHRNVVKLHKSSGVQGAASNNNPKVQQLSSTKPGGSDSSEKKNTDAKSDKVEGWEYIEELMVGMVPTIHCKLCDCSFTDLKNIEMHLKGRRHSLAGKTKGGRVKSGKQALLQRKDINMPFPYEMNMPFPYERNMHFPYERNMPFPYGYDEPPMYMETRPFFHPPPPPFVNPLHRMMQLDDHYKEDKHVMTKHSSICPPVAEFKAIEDIVGDTQKALKFVNVDLTEANKVTKTAEVKETPAEKSAEVNKVVKTVEVKENPAEKSAEANKVVKTEEVKESPAEKSGEKSTVAKDIRVLRGVVKVGDLANRLLLKGDLKAELVVMCAEKPTISLLEAVADKLPKHLEASKKKYEVKKDIQNAAIIVSSIDEPKTQVTLTLTSPIIRAEAEEGSTNPPDMLDNVKCLQALASLRRVRWYEACAANFEPCPMIIRILKELRQRVPTWTPLESWPLMLLVEKTISSLGKPVSPGESLRYVFEALASGVLLPEGSGIQDPCEKVAVDTTGNMTNQQREDITASAQHALRLISFTQIHKVLDMEELQQPRRSRNGGISRKRPLDNSSTETSEKKEKKEDS